MKKKIIILIAGVVLAIGITTGCQKIKYKDDFRAPLVGKYICTVKAYSKDFDCQQNNLMHTSLVVQDVQVGNDSVLIVKPSVSLQYDIKTLNYDSVEFVKKGDWWGTKEPVFAYTTADWYTSDQYRQCDLSISKDSFYLRVIESCYYDYYITGNKVK